MDHTLAICLNVFITHNVALTTQDNYIELPITIFDTDIKHNKHTYIVGIGDTKYKGAYVFNSNTLIFGTLTITDYTTNTINSYAVARLGDALRIYTTVCEYVEFHMCNPMSIITIHIIDDRKQLIGCFNLSRLYKDSYHIIGNTVYAQPAAVVDVNLLNTLFAITGTIDYDDVSCTDVVCFRSATMIMCIYSNAQTQLICTNIFPTKQNARGSIAVLNSDFKQWYTYTTDQAGVTNIIEYIADRNSLEHIKRDYTVSVSDGIITCGVPTKKQFKTTLNNNSISFKMI